MSFLKTIQLFVANNPGLTNKEIAAALPDYELHSVQRAVCRLAMMGIRGDIQAAQLVSAIYGSQGAKVPLDDAILRWGGDEQSAPKDPFAGLEAALTAATQ